MSAYGKLGDTTNMIKMYNKLSAAGLAVESVSHSLTPFTVSLILYNTIRSTFVHSIHCLNRFSGIFIQIHSLCFNTIIQLI